MSENFNPQHRENIFNGISEIFKRYERDLDAIAEELMIETVGVFENIFIQHNKELEPILHKLGYEYGSEDYQYRKKMVEKLAIELKKEGKNLFDMFRNTPEGERPSLNTYQAERLNESRRFVIEVIRRELPDLVKANPDFLSMEEQKPANETMHGYGRNYLGKNSKNSVFFYAFAFGEGQETPRHNHRARCISFVLQGDGIKEVGFADDKGDDALAAYENGREIVGRPKYEGSSTYVSREIDDGKFDWHIVINTGRQKGILFHIYDGLILEKDGLVKFETEKERPNVVERALPRGTAAKDIIAKKEGIKWPLVVYSDPKGEPGRIR